MKKLAFIFSAALLLLTACSETNPEVENIPNLRALSATEMTVSNSTNDFSFELFRSIQKETPENVFVSPFSVSMAFGMAMNGASEETQQSILNTIDYDAFSSMEVNQAYKDLTTLLLSMDRTVNLGIANSVWNHNQYTLKPAFAETIANYYGGTAQALNFKDPSAKETINHWVEEKTNNRIKDLIGGISPDEVLFIVNAIYFKGDWKYKFDKAKTHQAPFRREDGTTVPVDMMFAKGATIKYANQNGVQVLDIPYGNGQYRMTLLVPQDKTIKELLPMLSSTQLNQWFAEADSISTELEIPKFKMTWKDDVKEALSQMGMKMSGFPEMLVEPQDLAISRVVHQSFIEVNEEGSEAAAATAIGFYTTSLPPSPPRITIDKPFVFMIREAHSGVILFMGQLLEPDLLTD